MKKVYQRDAKDCGVTCLSYIIQYYKGYVPIERLREDTFTDHQGCTAYDLVETLKKYQFDSSGKRIKIEELKTIILPAIAHVILENGAPHFVVIVEINHRYVTVMDPSIGKVKYTYKKFQELWDGVILFAIPRKEIPKLPKEKNILKYLLNLGKLEKNLIVKMLLFHLLVTFLTLVSSFYLKVSLSGILEQNNLSSFYILAGVFGTMLFIKLILDYGKNVFKQYLNKNIESTFLYSFLRHIFRLPIKKIETYHEGEILTRIEEAREIKSLYTDFCVSLLLELSIGCLSLFILWGIDTSLFIILILGMMLYLILGILLSRFSFSSILKLMEKEVKWKSNIVELLNAIPTMKHLNAHAYIEEKMEESLCKNIDFKFSQERFFLKLGVLKESFLEILFFFITSFGIYQIYHQRLNLVDFVTFQSLYMYFISPLRAIVEVFPKFYYLKGIITKISEYVAIKEENLSESLEIFPIYSVEFSKVSFSYHGFHPTLNQVSFSIQNLEHVFLRGASGVGKSTICKLIIKEIEDYKGKIIVQGQDLKDISLDSIRKNIVYLSQKEKVFSMSIKENILFGTTTSESRFRDVCEICELESIVETRPLRYDSIVDETLLSGGEKERIILARFLIRTASFYLFDECLSEVDEKREKRIISKIRKFLEGKTLVYISHRNNARLFERTIEIENK